MLRKKNVQSCMPLLPINEIQRISDSLNFHYIFPTINHLLSSIVTFFLLSHPSTRHDLTTKIGVPR